MRELKFRYYSKKKRRMHEWENIKAKRNVTIASLEDNTDGESYSPWMQYTGLKDDYGNEIYEGDIVKVSEEMSSSYIGIVKFGKYNQDGSAGEYRPSKCLGFYVQMSDVDKNKKDECDYYVCYSFQHQNSLLELESLVVMGNIYENPELLEKEEA